MRHYFIEKGDMQYEHEEENTEILSNKIRTIAPNPIIAVEIGNTWSRHFCPRIYGGDDLHFSETRISPRDGETVITISLLHQGLRDN
jgi:hypothetical protein